MKKPIKSSLSPAPATSPAPAPKAAPKSVAAAPKTTGEAPKITSAARPSAPAAAVPTAAPAPRVPFAAAPAPAPVKAPVPAKPSAPASAAPAPAPVRTATATAVPTVIIAQVDVGFGNCLYVRGDGPGLSWDKGVQLDNVSSDHWKISLSKATKPVTFKFLINDETWSAGDDYTIKVGAEATFTPFF